MMPGPGNEKLSFDDDRFYERISGIGAFNPTQSEKKGGYIDSLRAINFPFFESK
jgi:hypothetical protein